MNFKLDLCCLAAMTMLLATGCIDSNYDLSDIDTEARIDVKDLTLPIVIDDIQLSNVMELNPGQAIKLAQREDGTQFYVMVQEGEFKASSIKIPMVHVIAPDLPSTTTTIHALTQESVRRKVTANPNAIVYTLSTNPTPFSYKAPNVDAAIAALDAFTGQMEMDWHITIEGAQGIIKSFTFTDLEIQLPKGLDLTATEGGNYNPSTGILFIPQRRVEGTSTILDLLADAINYKQAAGTLLDHTLLYSGAIYIKSGNLIVDTTQDLTPGAGHASVPTELTMKIAYDFSDIDVKSFTGDIQYDIKDFDMPSISMSNIPKVLSNNRTDLRIDNPCIFLNIENPFQKYNLQSIAGFKLTANRPQSKTDYEIDYNAQLGGNIFELTRANHQATYNYCISPTGIESIPTILPNDPDEKPLATATFTNPAPAHVAFTSLSNVLSGEAKESGIPQSISVSVGTPKIPLQKVKDFPLDSDNMGIHGSYLLYAPLRFDPGTEIVYADETTGWSSSTLQKLVITKMEVEVDVLSNLPIDATLSGYPLDKDGKQIAGVFIEPVTVKANGTSHLVLKVTGGDIRNLDGLYYEVVARSQDDNTPLSPSMTIKLSNIRPTVSGYYQDKL